MKRSIFKNVIVLLTMIVLIGFVGCKNELTNDVEIDEYSQSIINEYSKVGIEHNAMLSDFYSTFDVNPRSLLNDDIYYQKFVEFFGDDVEIVQVLDNFSRNVVESDVNMDSINQYTRKIDLLLDSESISTSKFQEDVTLIEVDAIANLSDEDLQAFMCFAEVAKASCEFWNGSDDGIKPRASLGKKIKACVASDALGALYGALITGTIVLTDPFLAGVVSSNPYALPIMVSLGAVICSAASSAEGYRTGTNVYVIPQSKVLTSLKAKKY